MCTFCENNWKLTNSGLTGEKPRNNYAEMHPWFGTIKETFSLPLSEYKEKGKSINCRLLESGEGAAWENKTVGESFPINYCPICGKFLGKTVEITEIKVK